MKTGIKFILTIALFAASFVLLLNLGVRANSWTFWLVLVMLPVAGFLVGKTDFRSSE